MMFTASAGCLEASLLLAKQQPGGGRLAVPIICNHFVTIMLTLQGWPPCNDEGWLLGSLAVPIQYREAITHVGTYPSQVHNRIACQQQAAGASLLDACF